MFFNFRVSENNYYFIFIKHISQLSYQWICLDKMSDKVLITLTFCQSVSFLK